VHDGPAEKIHYCIRVQMPVRGGRIVEIQPVDVSARHRTTPAEALLGMLFRY